MQEVHLRESLKGMGAFWYRATTAEQRKAATAREIFIIIFYIL
jgi:hypothetical protein